MAASSAMFFGSFSRGAGFSREQFGSSRLLIGALNEDRGSGATWCSQISTRQYTKADNGAYTVTWKLQDGRTVVQNIVIALP